MPNNSHECKSNSFWYERFSTRELVLKQRHEETWKWLVTINSHCLYQHCCKVSSFKINVCLRNDSLQCSFTLNVRRIPISLLSDPTFPLLRPFIPLPPLPPQRHILLSKMLALFDFTKYSKPEVANILIDYYYVN